MKLSWLASLGLLALGMGLIWYLHRRHERATRADYRDQLDAWYSDIPHISPLDLPTVKALKARKVDPSARVRRFTDRLRKEA